jgi:hypothetical protein
MHGPKTDTHGISPREDNEQPSSQGATSEENARHETPQNAAPDDLSEVEYLEREQQRAADDIQATLARVKTQLRDAADIKLWADAFPWSTVAIAAVAGFTAATAMIPKKHPPGKDGQASAAENGKADGGVSAPTKAAAPALMGTIVASLFDLAKTALERSFAASRAETAATEAVAQSHGRSERDTAAPV